MLAGVSVVVVASTAALRSGLIQPPDTRIVKLFLLLVENPVLLLTVDASVNERAFHIYFSFLGALEHYLLPRGYSAWAPYLEDAVARFGDLTSGAMVGRIMSGYGSAFFELGFMAVLIPGAITLGLYRFYQGDRKMFLVMAAFIHTVLMTAIPLAFPLIGFIIGYLAFYARQRQSALAPAPGASL
jgi:hypothetical protein